MSEALMQQHSRTTVCVGHMQPNDHQNCDLTDVMKTNNPNGDDLSVLLRCLRIELTLKQNPMNAWDRTLKALSTNKVMTSLSNVSI
jgi:hypothetical protein